jgi:two-component system, OmpR family, response regulator
MPQILLLVDDDPPILDTLSLFLEKQGFTIYTADGGEKCISLLGTTRPDLILLDIMMEPMDGWETLLAIRDNPKTRDIPVMMVTAKPPTRDEIQTYGGEVDDYLMKPLDPRIISASVRQTIDSSDQMLRTVEALRARGVDEDRVHEYISLLRRVRLTQKLFGRFRHIWNADIHFLGQQESRLARLNKELGIAASPAAGNQDPGGK